MVESEGFTAMRGHRGQGWYASRDMLRVRGRKNEPAPWPLVLFVIITFIPAAAILVIEVLYLIFG
jgi:hypothetical protein